MHLGTIVAVATTVASVAIMHATRISVRRGCTAAPGLIMLLTWSAENPAMSFSLIGFDSALIARPLLEA